ncbi:MAG: MarR family transcriptional regulator [Deltaproteobacteria bacterium]|nr:MarR family transcriptional regulator [Deltaproteobacteria bacterium]
MFSKQALARISRIRETANSLIINYLKQRGISELVPSHGDILMALYKSENAMTVREISEKIHRKSSTVVVLIDKLENSGWVYRNKSKKDKRITLISLTPKAIDIYSVFNEVSDLLMNTIYEGFTEIEILLFENLLEKIFNNLKKLDI